MQPMNKIHALKIALIFGFIPVSVNAKYSNSVKLMCYFNSPTESVSTEM